MKDTIWMITPKTKLQRRINFMSRLGYDYACMVSNKGNLLIKWNWRV